MNAWKKSLTCGTFGLFFLWGAVASLGWYGERQSRLAECQRLQGIVNQLQRYAQKGFGQNAQEARAKGEKKKRQKADRRGADSRLNLPPDSRRKDKTVPE
jgi:hypothetical protein